MKVIGIIPARMASTRFPGKPLKEILGKPMIYHVYFRSKMASIFKDVYIATCDKQIKDYCLGNNMSVIMTKDTHQRASDRAAEAMTKVEKKTGKKTDIVVMIQGDEPMVYPGMIEQAVTAMLRDKTIQVVNLMAPLESKQEQEDPNAIKIVVDKNNFALYFSREPIPTRKKGIEKIPMYKQVCIIPFRRNFLLKFNRLSSTALEMVESIDMLRILEHGFKVKMALTKFKTYSVDTSEDLRKVEKLMEKDPLCRKYC